MNTSKKDEPSLTEHWFFRVLIGLVLVAGLFYSASRYLSDVYDDVGEYKVSLMTDRFIRSVGHIHQQWSMSGKPSSMLIDYYTSTTDSKKIRVVLSQKGWPINIGSDINKLDCGAMWRYLAQSTEDQLSELTVVANEQGDVCFYRWVSQSEEIKVLEYDSLKGKMKQQR